MKQSNDYFAFISYKSEDVEWAIWVQHELEHYHLPASYNGRADVRQDLRPVFRDIDELSAGNLPEQIKHALVNSQNLIVICSPLAAKSPWVNQEVKTFISLGRTDRIFPFIIEGDSPKEFFPPSLLNLPKNQERLGGDVSKNGRDTAFVKIVAGMLGVGFDSLWNRYEKEKAEEERKQREQREKLLRAQSRFLAEKANSLVGEGDSYTARLLALEALPKNIDNPDRPYVIEAEVALRNACSENNCILRGHTGDVTSVAFSPNGKLLASASLDDYIRLWDVQTGNYLFKLKKPSMRLGKFDYDLLEGLIDEIQYLGFNSVSFSSDGNFLVSAGRDSAIYVWDLSKKECITRMYNYDIHYGVNYATFSRDGKTILSAGGYLNEDHDYIPGFSIWDTKTGVHLFDKDSKGDVNFINISPDGNKIATAGYGIIHIWDANNFNLLGCLRYQEKNKYNSSPKAVFSPNGSLIASSSNDTIRIWQVETGKQIQSFKTQNVKIKTIAFSLDGLSIFSGGKDNVIYRWGIKNGKCDKTLKGHVGEINTIAISPTGKYVASGSNDHTIRLTDTEDSAIITIKPSVHINDGEVIFYNIEESYKLKINNKGIISLLNPYSEQTVKTFCNEDHRTWMEKENWYSFDNTKMAFYDIDGNSLIINDKKNNIDYALNSPSLTEIKYAVFSPDGDNVLSLSYDKEICIFKSLPHTAEEIKTQEEDILLLKGHIDNINWAAFSHDGKNIVSVSKDKTIRVWDFLSGECIQVFHDDDDSIWFVDFTPDGRYIITISYYKTIKIWKFQMLRDLIDNNRNYFNKRHLSQEERKKYYLE